MAKEKKEAVKNAVNALETATVENVLDVVKNGSIVTDGLSKEIDESIEKDLDDQVKRQVKNRKCDSLYEEALAKIKLVKNRREEKIKLKELTIKGNLRRQLCGGIVDETFIAHNKLDAKAKEFDVEFYGEDSKKNITFTKQHIKAGEKVPQINYLLYDRARADLEEKLRKEQNESDKQYRLEKQEIEAYFGDYWSPSWRY